MHRSAPITATERHCNYGPRSERYSSGCGLTVAVARARRLYKEPTLPGGSECNGKGELLYSVVVEAVHAVGTLAPARRVDGGGVVFGEQAVRTVRVVVRLRDAAPLVGL